MNDCSEQHAHLIYHFTGKERDTESNLDNFGARYYSSAQGRFLTADWSAIPEPIPYADLDDPQTLNLYAYVGNNPLDRVDPDGHCLPCFIEEFVESPTVQELMDKAEPYVAGAVSALAAGLATVKGLLSGPSASAPVLEPGGYHLGQYLARENNKSTSESKPGTLGKADHQQTVKEEAQKMGGKPEVRVDTPGGQKGSRVIDAAKTENGKVTEATQVIRPNKNGTSPAREVRAANDIHNATGVKPKLVPVRPVKKPSESN